MLGTKSLVLCVRVLNPFHQASGPQTVWMYVHGMCAHVRFVPYAVVQQVRNRNSTGGNCHGVQAYADWCAKASGRSAHAHSQECGATRKLDGTPLVHAMKHLARENVVTTAFGVILAPL